jgi:hypothetical protein
MSRSSYLLCAYHWENLSPQTHWYPLPCPNFFIFNILFYLVNMIFRFLKKFIHQFWCSNRCMQVRVVNFKKNGVRDKDVSLSVVRVLAEDQSVSVECKSPANRLRDVTTRFICDDIVIKGIKYLTFNPDNIIYVMYRTPFLKQKMLT